MLSEQLLQEWTALSAKVIAKIKLLKEVIAETNQRYSPAQQAKKKKLTTQISSLQTQIKAKQAERAKMPTIESVDCDSEDDLFNSNPLDREINKLKNQVQKLDQELMSLDFAPRLLALQSELRVKNDRIQELETEIQANYAQINLASERTSYETQIQALQTNYEGVNKKLDRIRNLLSQGMIKSLQTLYKKGQI